MNPNQLIHQTDSTVSFSDLIFSPLGSFCGLRTESQEFPEALAGKAYPIRNRPSVRTRQCLALVPRHLSCGAPLQLIGVPLQTGEAPIHSVDRWSEALSRLPAWHAALNLLASIVFIHYS